jgi:hypothetical protein
VHAGPNGGAQLQVYPAPKQSPGNFSLVSIGPAATGPGTFANWIDYGPSQSDIQYLLSSQLMPVSITNGQQWPAGPGLADTLVNDFSTIVGQPNLIPVFKPVSTSPYQAASNTGSNSTYDIVGFVSVQVSEVSGNGSKLNLSLQPMGLLDPTATTLNLKPAGTTTSSSFSTSLTTFAPPKLTN